MTPRLAALLWQLIQVEHNSTSPELQGEDENAVSSHFPQHTKNKFVFLPSTSSDKVIKASEQSLYFDSPEWVPPVPSCHGKTSVLPSKRLLEYRSTAGAAARWDSLGGRAVSVRSCRQAKHAYLSTDILVESLSQHLVESSSHTLFEGIADQHPPCVQKQNCGTTKATCWLETFPGYCLLF